MHKQFLCLIAVVVAASNNLLRGVATEAKVAAAGAAGLAAPHPLFGWWELLTRGEPGSALQLFDPRWWLSYIAQEFEAEPAHVIVEILCIVTILYLLLWRKPEPMQQEKLTKKEEDELIAEWKPETLCPTWTKPNKTRFIVESCTGRTVIANGENYLNFASNNFLGLADKPEVKAGCRATIEKYGVGSCGPRGFYGTFDLHLEVEKRLAEFMQAQEAIIYSDALACVSSVIPAFAKKGDIIIVDDSTNFGIQQGCMLSRSTIYYFKHGDMDDLERVLKSIHQKEKQMGAKAKHYLSIHRKFIVIEGVSSIYGDIIPLDRVLKLKKQYGYRLIMDDSLGFGVLGETGRGTIEHFDCNMQPDDHNAEPGVDILCASMDGSLASVGGFCVGNHQVVDHQRLSGAGYCFSATSPPYTATTTLITLGMIEAQPQLCANLRKKAAKLRRSLAGVHRNLVVLGSESNQSDESPVIHLALKNSDPSRYSDETALFDRLNDTLRVDSGLIASVPEFIPADRCKAKPTLRIAISTLHTDADLEKLVKGITQAAGKVLPK